MKYYILVILALMLTSCVDDRGCYEWESQEECDARLSGEGYEPPVDFSVGVYRCENMSTQETLNETRMQLIEIGIDVKQSNCATLNTPHKPQPIPCDGAGYTEIDIHVIPYESVRDATEYEGSNFVGIYPQSYTVIECL